MPTYDYKCNACSHRFEHFQSMRDSPMRKCPKCGKNALERLIGTGAAVIFKGSGFYQTDYRSDAYKKSAEAESKPASSDKNGGGDKADKPKTETAGAANTEPASKPEPAKPSGDPNSKPKKRGKKSGN